MLSEVATSSTEITIDDVQVKNSDVPSTEEQGRLRQLIWKSKHLLIRKGNALPHVARGAVCDIDVSDANTIAQRVRPVTPKLREKLADLIKGMLSANYSTFDIALGVANSRDHQENRRRYQAIYLL